MFRNGVISSVSDLFCLSGLGYGLLLYGYGLLFHQMFLTEVYQMNTTKHKQGTLHVVPHLDPDFTG